MFLKHCIDSVFPFTVYSHDKVLLDDKIDRKIDDTAMRFLLVQNGHQTHGWTLIGSDTNGIYINIKIKI